MVITTGGKVLEMRINEWYPMLSRKLWKTKALLAIENPIFTWCKPRCRSLKDYPGQHKKHPAVVDVAISGLPIWFTSASLLPPTNDLIANRCSLANSAKEKVTRFRELFL